MRRLLIAAAMTLAVTVAAQGGTTSVWHIVQCPTNDPGACTPPAFTNWVHGMVNSNITAGITGKWDKADGLASTEVLRIYIEGTASSNAILWTGKTDLVEFLLTSDVFRVYLDGLGSSNAVMWTGKWDKADGLSTTEVLRGQIEILESATHARQHAINSADDHVGLEAVQNNIVIFDGFGFPVVDSGTALSALLHADGSVTWTGDQPANENGIDDVGKLQTTGNDYLFFSRADAEWCAGNAAGTDKVYIDLQPAGGEYIMVVYTEVGNQFQVGDWGIGLAQGPTNINEISTDTSLSGTDRVLPTVPAVKGYADTKLPLATNTPSGSGKIPYSTGTTGTNWYWADAPAADSSVTGSVQVGSETNAANVIRTTFVASQATQTVMDVWLSDAVGQGPLATAPDGGVAWVAGTNLYAYAANKHYRALSDSSGKIVLDWTESALKTAYANLSVGPLWSYGGPLTWTNAVSGYWTDTNSANLYVYYPMVVTGGAMVATYPLDSGNPAYGNWAARQPSAAAGPAWYKDSFTNILGRAGSYFSFDGSDDQMWLSFSNSFTMNGSNYTFITVQKTTDDNNGYSWLWDSQNNVGGVRTLIAWEHDTDDRMSYYNATDGFALTMTNTPYEDGAWHHLAIVFQDDSSQRWYMDGNLMWTGTWRKTAFVNSGTQRFSLCGTYDGYCTTLDIAAMWIYSNACSQAFIQEHWTNVCPSSVNGDLYPRP